MRYRHPSRLRHMKRFVFSRLFRLACVLLCVILVVTLWMSKSYRFGCFVRDRWVFAEDGNFRMVVFIYGIKSPFSRFFFEPLSEHGNWRSQIESNPPPSSSPWITRHSKEPIWVFLLGVSAATGCVYWMNWRNRPPPKGSCPGCGYNLTGNESGKCPECSTPVPKQETTA